jgi:hypothetical protein
MNPFEKNLSELSDSELEQNLNNLTEKFFISQRLGKVDLLTQLSNFITLYRDELQIRYRKNLKMDDDLDQLINVE